jgi:hypothetical protein
MSSNCESFILSSGWLCLFRKDFVCVGLRSAQNDLLSSIRDEVEVESEVLCARCVGRRCAGVTAGVQRPSCCAERLIGMSLLQKEH